MLRKASGGDRPALFGLQAHLAEPSPALLEFGLEIGRVLVSTANDRVVGYALPVAGDGVHLAELVVAPAHRREGRASALLGAVRAGADGPVTVAVEPDNRAALALYRSRGFEVLAEREGYFASGPALLLSE